MQGIKFLKNVSSNEINLVTDKLNEAGSAMLKLKDKFKSEGQANRAAEAERIIQNLKAAVIASQTWL